MKTRNDLAQSSSNKELNPQHSSTTTPKHDNLIRPPAPTDWDRMARIYNEAIHSGRSTMDLIPVNATYFRKLAEGFTTRECLLVVERAGEVAGWGIVKQYSDRPGYALACETSVYVAEDNQGQGFGRPLQSAIVQKAWSFGYRHLVAKILAVNGSSIRFHHHFAYQIAGIQKQIGFLNGIWHDIVIMQCILTDAQPEESTS